VLTVFERIRPVDLEITPPIPGPVGGMSGERVERGLAAILAADVAGYSRLMGRTRKARSHASGGHRLPQGSCVSVDVHGQWQELTRSPKPPTDHSKLARDRAGPSPLQTALYTTADHPDLCSRGSFEASQA